MSFVVPVFAAATAATWTTRTNTCRAAVWVVLLVGWIPKYRSVAFSPTWTTTPPPRGLVPVLADGTNNRPNFMSVRNTNDANDDDGAIIIIIIQSDAIEPNTGLARTNARNSISSDVGTDQDDTTDEAVQNRRSRHRRELILNAVTGGLLMATSVSSAYLYQTMVYTPPGFVRAPSLQYIAAVVGDAKASRGTFAPNQPWGLWRLDPGPRGVRLRDYETTMVASSASSVPSSSCMSTTTPSGWTLNPNDWWLEEHGILMEAPEFPLPSGRYLVTGGRNGVVTGLTIDQTTHTWQLDNASLYDVTHLPCRAARYRSQNDNFNCVSSSPASANPADFPVAPGAVMPSVPGCWQQDYAVLFVLGREKAGPYV